VRHASDELPAPNDARQLSLLAADRTADGRVHRQRPCARRASRLRAVRRRPVGGRRTPLGPRRARTAELRARSHRLCTDVPFGFSGFVATASVKLTRRKLSGVQTQRWRISRGNTSASVTRLVGPPTSGDALGPHALPELPQRDPPLSARHGTRV